MRRTANLLATVACAAAASAADAASAGGGAGRVGRDGPEGRAPSGRGAVAELLTGEGRRVRGVARAAGTSGSALRRTEGAAGGKLTVGGYSCAADRVVSLRFGALDEPRLRLSRVPPADAIEQGLVLRNGDVMRGVVASLQSGQVKFVSDSLGPVDVPASDVRKMAFGRPRARTLLASDPRESPRRPARETGSGRAAGVPGVTLVNGDFVSGRAVWVNPETVGVSLGARIVKLPRERTAAIALAPDDPEADGGANEGDAAAGRDRPGRPGAAPPAVHRVRLVNGDRLSGRLVSLTPALLELEVSFAGVARLPVSVLRELWSDGGPLVSLSSVGPAEVREVPFFDERFPYRADRNLAGAFLSVGGRRFERGLGCHSRCELEYDLRGLPGGPFAAFLAEVGIDDLAAGASGSPPAGGSAPGRGEVVFRVLLDGKTAYESGPVRAGEPARLVRVELGHASRLRLVVDFGPDGSSAGDHADWGHAVLVR